MVDHQLRFIWWWVLRPAVPTWRTCVTQHGIPNYPESSISNTSMTKSGTTTVHHGLPSSSIPRGMVHEVLQDHLKINGLPSFRLKTMMHEALERKICDETLLFFINLSVPLFFNQFSSFQSDLKRTWNQPQNLPPESPFLTHVHRCSSYICSRNTSRFMKSNTIVSLHMTTQIV